MKKINEQIVLRPLADGEENLWRGIFYDSVRENFAPLGLGETDLNNLLESQFQAQAEDYRRNYPLAVNEVILYENVPAGRLISSTEDGDIHVLDIIIIGEYRNRGIGGKIFKNLFEQSRRTAMPVRIYVEKINRAVNFYEKLGFQKVEDVISHFKMEWRG